MKTLPCNTKCLAICVLSLAFIFCSLPGAVAPAAFAGPTDLSISTASLPNGEVGNLYSLYLSAAGGVPPYTWGVTGKFPPGIGITSSGAIQAIPLVAGTFTFTVHVQDSAGGSATADFTWIIDKGVPTFTNLNPQSVVVGTATTDISGKIATGILYPSGSVSISLAGRTKSANINPLDGTFTSTFATNLLEPYSSPYKLTYSYSGDANFTPAVFVTNMAVNKASTKVSVSPATMEISLSQTSVALSATVSGLAVTEGTITFQVNDTTGPVGPSLTTPVGSGGATTVSYPVKGGLSPAVYTIVATYSGGPNSLASQGTGTLTIGPGANPTLTMVLGPGSADSKTSNDIGVFVSGYAVLDYSTSSAPMGIANFRYVAPATSDSPAVLITEAGVAAATPLTATRLFVDYSSSTDSGVAVVNPGTAAINIDVELRSTAGTVAGTSTISLDPGAHTAMFASQLIPGLPNPFSGTLTLTSPDPFVTTNLSIGTNGRGETLYSTLPTPDLNAVRTDTSLVFPQIVTGGGTPTQILLMNPSGDVPCSGSIYLFDVTGSPQALDFGAFSGPQSQIDFTIAPNGMAEFTTQGAGPLLVGHAIVVSTAGPLPVGSVIFRFRQNGQLVSQAGVPASPQVLAARMFVEVASTPYVRDTGIAIVNPGAQPATVSLKLTGSDGSVQTGSLPLGPNSQVAEFLNELFPGKIPADFSGVLDISSDQPISPLTLRMTINERGEALYSTLPLADLANPPVGRQYLPQFVDGDGYKTQLILINTSSQPGIFLATVYDDRGNPVDPAVLQ